MSPDGTNIVATDFNRESAMVEPVVYEKGKESNPDLTWGHWIVFTHPVECSESGNIIECQKHITVDPQNSLSLQIHEGREERYIGLEGTTKICVNGEIFDLKKGDDVFLPRGCLHFSWNETDKKSKFHEIQSGLHCDELDIKRAADKLKPDHMLHTDEEVIKMMIDVAKDRYDSGEAATYDYNSSNPNMERIANSDLLNIYVTYKDDLKKLHSKMNDVLQKCKQQHAQLTPNPKSQPQKICAVK